MNSKHSKIDDNALKDELFAIASGHRGFIEWGKVFLPHYFTVEPGSFHYEIAATVEKNLRVAIASPRDHAKSTLITLCYVLFRMCVYKEPYSIIISDTYDQACEHIGNIFSELTTNEDLLAFYPHVMLETHSVKRQEKNKIVTKRRQSDFITVGDLRVRAFGAGMKVRGRRHKQFRPTLCLLDDLENDVDVENEESRGKLWSWLTSALIPAVARLGRIVMIGTILHEDSILNRIMLGKLASFKTKFYSAITAAGKCLWPARWSLASLRERRKEIGTTAFSKEYLNKPVNDLNSLFKQPWVHDNRFTTQKYTTIKDRIERIIVAVDPSATNNKDSDECGIIVAAIARDFFNKITYYVLEDASIKASPKTWARRVLDVAAKWGANSIVVETNIGGELITATLEAVLEDNEYMPSILGVRASKGKSTRAEPIAVLYENGLVHHVGEYPELESQMFNWKPGKKSPDRMDAMVWALTALFIYEPVSTNTPVITKNDAEMPESLEDNPYIKALQKPLPQAA